MNPISMLLRRRKLNPAEEYIKTLNSPNSIRNLESRLDCIARFLSDGEKDHHTYQWYKIKPETIIRFRSEYARDHKASTVNIYLIAIHQVLKMAWVLGIMSQDNYLKCTGIPRLKEPSALPGRMLDDDELSALKEACLDEETPAGRRDWAMIELMAIFGPRRSEVTNLQLSDYDSIEGTIFIRESKEGETRTVYLNYDAQQSISDWIAARGLNPGYLFTSIDRANRINPRMTRMADKSIEYIMKKRAEQAGIDSFSPHDLRRTAVSRMLNEGWDYGSVAKVVGHKSLNSTAEYDRRPDASLIELTQERKSIE